VPTAEPEASVDVAVISVCTVADRHIIAAVRERWPTAPVFLPTWRTDGDRVERLGRTLRSPVVSARRRTQRALAARRERVIAELLPPVPSKHDLGVRRIAASDLNAPTGIDQLSATRPDVLVLSGAPILRDAVLAVPSVGTLNVHFGISPWYRGEHTLFHALRRGEDHHVGLTLHGVDLGVDTGPIVAQAYPELGPGDGEAEAFARCAFLAADLLVERLEVIERTEEIAGRAQTERGTLYRRDDRHVVRHDLATAVARRRRGRERAPRPERTVRYEASAEGTIAPDRPTGTVSPTVS
jgi:methionyl-tRNA formyltransferase